MTGRQGALLLGAALCVCILAVGNIPQAGLWPLVPLVLLIRPSLWWSELRATLRYYSARRSLHVDRDRADV